MQIGIDSFAAAYDDANLAVDASDRLRNLVEQIEHADQVGLDAFGIGEHHRREYLDSAPALGGISRISFQMNAASLPHAKLMQAIETIGTRVAPAVRARLADERQAPARRTGS